MDLDTFRSVNAQYQHNIWKQRLKNLIRHLATDQLQAPGESPQRKLSKSTVTAQPLFSFTTFLDASWPGAGTCTDGNQSWIS
jgi:hypothetical protein